MTIVINTKYILRAYQQEYSEFIYECFSRIADLQRQHTFIFVADVPFDTSMSLYQNCIALVVAPTFLGTFSGLFYQIKIYSLLKKYNADVYLHAGSVSALFVKTPQCFHLHRPDYLSRKDFIQTNRLYIYKTCIPFFLAKAKSIITAFQCSKNYIAGRYGTDVQKIEVVNHGTNDVAGMPDEEKESIKAEYAGGQEYFLFTGEGSSQSILLNLLKSFSHFKKWQKSSMQLIIVLRDKVEDKFINSLSLFRYKSEVKLFTNTSAAEVNKILSAAYCMLFFSFNEWPVSVVLQAMNRDVPIIIDNTSLTVEMCGEAAMYANFEAAPDLAEKITNMYKDENLRRQLIEKGRRKTAEYSWDKASGLVWQCLLKVKG